MITVHSYPIAIALCVITMLCWGSWANTLKMEPKSYSFSLFYWDQSIAYMLLALMAGLTFGSFGMEGRSFFADLSQASASSYGWALLGGAVFNLANMLFMAALGLAGMAIAYPIAIGLALVEGVVINYIAEPKGAPLLIFTGVAFITLAIILDALAYRNAQKKTSGPSRLRLGISLALGGGVLMGLFYFLVQRSLSLDFGELDPGKFGPYAGVFVYCVGSFLSNFLFNSYLMSHPIEGVPVKYGDYFKSGTLKFHAIGALGGVINGIGVTASFAASKAAGPAVAYGLGQCGTMIAAIWGIFIWKETKGASKATNGMIAAMFVFFIAGLSLLVTSMTR